MHSVNLGPVLHTNMFEFPISSSWHMNLLYTYLLAFKLNLSNRKFYKNLHTETKKLGSSNMWVYKTGP